MDSIGEVVARVVGEIVREFFEALVRYIFGQIARFIGFIYDGIYRIVRWNLDSDSFATPVAILVLMALGGTIFFVLVKTIQWLIA